MKNDFESLVRPSSVSAGSLPVLVPWSPPDAFADVTTDDLRKVQAAIGAGFWRKNHQAKAWAGIAVASVLGLDADKKCDKAKIKTLLAEWLKNGVLEEEQRPDEKRMGKVFLVVGRVVS